MRGFARARSFACARGVNDDDANDDATDGATRATMRMMTTTTTTTTSVRAMRANDGRAMFRTRGMGAPTATGEETRREAMRRKLMVTTEEVGEFRDEGETEGDGDGDGDAMAVRGESRGVHRAPEFVRRPRDASGRPRAMGEGGTCTEYPPLRGRAPIRSVVASRRRHGRGGAQRRVCETVLGAEEEIDGLRRHGSTRIFL